MKIKTREYSLNLERHHSLVIDLKTYGILKNATHSGLAIGYYLAHAKCNSIVCYYSIRTNEFVINQYRLSAELCKCDVDNSVIMTAFRMFCLKDRNRGLNG